MLGKVSDWDTAFRVTLGRGPRMNGPAGGWGVAWSAGGNCQGGGADARLEIGATEDRIAGIETVTCQRERECRVAVAWGKWRAYVNSWT